MFATNFGCFCKINYFWLPCVQLLAHTNLGGVSEFSQENKYSWPRKPRHLRSSEDMKIHKKVSGQENNLFLTTDNQLFALLVFLLVEEEVFFGGVVGPNVFYAFVGFALVFHFL